MFLSFPWDGLWKYGRHFNRTVFIDYSASYSKPSPCWSCNLAIFPKLQRLIKICSICIRALKEAFKAKVDALSHFVKSLSLFWPLHSMYKDMLKLLQTDSIACRWCISACSTIFLFSQCCAHLLNIEIFYVLNSQSLLAGELIPLELCLVLVHSLLFVSSYFSVKEKLPTHGWFATTGKGRVKSSSLCDLL